MRTQRLLFVLAATSLAVWACSSPAPGPSGPATSTSTNDAKSGSGSGTGSAGPSAASAPSASGSAAPAASSAAAGGAADACGEACDQKHPHGAQTMDQLFTSCVCAASACASACATSDCANPPKSGADGDACDTCESTGAGASCFDKQDSACQADPDCVALMACYDACAPDAGAGE
jgi:hypothetical protein